MGGHFRSASHYSSGAPQHNGLATVPHAMCENFDSLYRLSGNIFDVFLANMGFQHSLGHLTLSSIVPDQEKNSVRETRCRARANVAAMKWLWSTRPDRDPAHMAYICLSESIHPASVSVLRLLSAFSP